ncbi:MULTISPECIES: hypothetical protein [Thiorhodovibrio]|uniref:hypothetical protein n=1 Tax=Thiorhodovibrio TaxID=61593 RepID=UPI00191191EE|nr:MULTISPECIES: hypothetical protein [Thiorhodovibrio]MBK5967691.1 hypothetical protein [Thiorhodovibrio winogradskyi]WPL11639.1 hypothetical protein Thiosp_01389 [Thiorhodovibrio litoralis]
MSHRLLVLGCETMRDGVVVAGIFFAAAVALFMAARYVVPADIAHLQAIVLLLALVLIMLAPVVLISTFLLSVLPGAREKLGRCEH